MKKLFALITAAVVALGLSACSTPAGAESGKNDTPYRHYTFWQDTPGNGKVLCVWAEDSYSGGLSCDWTGATHG